MQIRLEPSATSAPQVAISFVYREDVRLMISGGKQLVNCGLFFPNTPKLDL